MLSLIESGFCDIVYLKTPSIENKANNPATIKKMEKGIQRKLRTTLQTFNRSRSEEGQKLG